MAMRVNGLAYSFEWGGRPVKPRADQTGQYIARACTSQTRIARVVDDRCVFRGGDDSARAFEHDDGVGEFYQLVRCTEPVVLNILHGLSEQSGRFQRMWCEYGGLPFGMASLQQGEQLRIVGDGVQGVCVQHQAGGY